MNRDAEWTSRSDAAVGGGTRASATPWVLVVARGHGRLVAQLQAIFQEDPRIQVIENRRQGRALLPRGEVRLRPTF
jgi:hypothetical protein